MTSDPAPAPPSTVRWLAGAAVLAPLAFTLAWLVLGATRPGYSPTGDTISELAAVSTPLAGVMVAAFVVQGLGQLACAALAWRRYRAAWLAGWLVVAGLGTLAAGVLRLPDPVVGGPASGHSLGATAAFVGLHLAVAAGGLSRRLPRALRLAAVPALAVALPNLAWFLTHLSGGGAWYGGSEKAFVTVLLAWCVGLAVTAARFPGTFAPLRPVSSSANRPE